MSELIATSSGEIRARDALLGYWWDEKSESDKVITELENRIDEGDKEFDVANEQNERLLKIVRHQKYKRCLAMAERCKDKIENVVQYNEHDDWLIINEYWERWHERWLKIAERFKEVK